MFPAMHHIGRVLAVAALAALPAAAQAADAAPKQVDGWTVGVETIDQETFCALRKATPKTMVIYGLSPAYNALVFVGAQDPDGRFRTPVDITTDDGERLPIAPLEIASGAALGLVTDATALYDGRDGGAIRIGQDGGRQMTLFAPSRAAVAAMVDCQADRLQRLWEEDAARRPEAYESSQGLGDFSAAGRAATWRHIAPLIGDMTDGPWQPLYMAEPADLPPDMGSYDLVWIEPDGSMNGVSMRPLAGGALNEALVKTVAMGLRAATCAIPDDTYDVDTDKRLQRSWFCGEEGAYFAVSVVATPRRVVFGIQALGDGFTPDAMLAGLKTKVETLGAVIEAADTAPAGG